MTATLIPDATGDPRKVDWSRVCSTGMWSLAKNGEKHPNNISMRIAADSQYLYLNYLEQTPPGKSGSGNAFWRNCVEIFFAEYPCLPVWHIGISPDGVLQQLKHSLQNEAEQMEKCDLQGIFYNENKGNSWNWLMALPLENLPFGKQKIALTANFFRFLAEGQSAAWTPLFFMESYIQGIKRYGRIYLPRIEYPHTQFRAPFQAEDPNASDGQTAAMDGNKGWTLQCPLAL